MAYQSAIASGAITLGPLKTMRFKWSHSHTDHHQNWLQFPIPIDRDPQYRQVDQGRSERIIIYKALKLMQSTMTYNLSGWEAPQATGTSDGLRAKDVGVKGMQIRIAKRQLTAAELGVPHGLTPTDGSLSLFDPAFVTVGGWMAAHVHPKNEGTEAGQGTTPTGVGAQVDIEVSAPVVYRFVDMGNGNAAPAALAWLYLLPENLQDAHGTYLCLDYQWATISETTMLRNMENQEVYDATPTVVE